MVIEIKNRIKRYSFVSLNELALGLAAQKEAIEPILNLMEKKGLIKKLECKTPCKTYSKTCQSCRKNIFYTWNG